MNMIERDRLLEDVYKAIEINTLPGGKFARNSSIQAKVNFLLKKTTQTRYDLIHDVFLSFILHKYHEKYDPEQSKLDTYVKNFIDWFLLGAIKITEKNPETLVSDVTYIKERQNDKT